MIRFLDAGESHGEALVAVIEGLPANLKIDVDYINKNLLLRQSGYGRGQRQKIEKDRIKIVSGVRFGKTIGSPVAIMIQNRDFENWLHIMSPFAEYTDEKAVTSPRPGHADLTGYIKYDRSDIRDVLERSSARETAVRVAVGSFCELLLKEIGVDLLSFVRSIGSVYSQEIDINDNDIITKIESSPVFCPDTKSTDLMIAEIEEAKKSKDSIGGSVEVVVRGVDTGLGSYSQWDRKLDAKIAFGLMSIQAVKAVEVGDGFENSKKLGSLVQDEIVYDNGYKRKTNRAGGIEGGMSNGENIVVRAFMKPIPTIVKGMDSVDVKTKQYKKSDFERSDVCAVPALSVVAKSVVAFDIANAYIEKFGADTIDELKTSVELHRDFVKQK